MIINSPLILAITIGKLISFLLKITGTGGTAAPGLIALKIYSPLIQKLSSQLGKNILITGTNGKTTTARMLATILNQAKIKHLHNRAGSNLLRGIASALIKNVSLLGKLPKNYLGLWEVDEAAFPLACKAIKPNIVLISNLFRDQLDRYGEIDTLASKWQKALEKLPKNSTIILNADDATVASLGKNLPGKILYFGLSYKKLGSKKPKHASDATVCPYCFSELKYKACFVSHLGIYSCPKCGQIQPKKNVYLKKVTFQKNRQNKQTLLFERSRELLTDKTSRFLPHSAGSTRRIKTTTALPGTYNLYNFTAATTLALALKIPKNTIIKGLTNFKPAFGRVEKIRAGNKTLNIFLVKNPTGFNEVIETLIKPKLTQYPLSFERSRELAQIRTSRLIRFNRTRSKNKVRDSYKRKKQLTCLIALNDLIADGTDVSWIWDVAFEKLIPHLKNVIVSGTRAYDMALRLKYANKTGNWKPALPAGRLATGNWKIQPNLKKAINQLLTTNNQQLYILPTYTAMLEIRKILNKMGLVHSSWED